jgi:hypothetical protein
MWSGPRNISTAMMRSFGNRPDTAVVDEPFYGIYLAATGLDHPGRAEVIASQPADWRAVVAALTGPVPGGARVFYQKHMAHHLLAAIGRDWLDEVANAFLIRHPRPMLASYARVRAEVGLEDTGLPQQVEIFRRVADRTGRAPPVVDAADVLAAPRALLERLCLALGLDFAPAMLAWPAGPRPTDGVWARHWYAAVEGSTGFAPQRQDPTELPDGLERLTERCLPYYEVLAAARLAA